MNEYTILFLNGITKYITADEWKDAISLARSIAKKENFFPKIKMICDGEGDCIKNIDENLLTFTHINQIYETSNRM